MQVNDQQSAVGDQCVGGQRAMVTPRWSIKDQHHTNTEAVPRITALS
jgi:hypothetical protein